MPGREIARQHDADLVGEDLVALVVDHAAAVAVAVEAEADVGLVLDAPPRLMACSIFMSSGLGL